MSNILLNSIEALPRFIRDMIFANFVALIRTDAPVVVNEVMKEELVASIEIYQYCAKCGEHAAILSTNSFCHGCVEYGYTVDAEGKAVPPYVKLAAGGVVRANNLFSDDDMLMMIV
jgi:hypothetical protein